MSRCTRSCASGFRRGCDRAHPRVIEGWMARIGRWLFAHRGVVPVPLAVVAIVAARPVLAMALAGAVLVTAGLAIRLWGVAHIGPSSRTRGAEVVPLVSSGPYRFCRNPLYVGNIVAWTGVGLLAGRGWLAAVAALAMSVHYTLVVRWEEENLARKLGEPYVAYLARVPRWPTGQVARASGGEPDWLAAVRGERSTWLAAAVVIALVLASAARG